MDNAERLHRLAEIAADHRDLPVYAQFQILQRAGLSLDDINWRNRVSHPGLVTEIPTLSSESELVA